MFCQRIVSSCLGGHFSFPVKEFINGGPVGLSDWDSVFGDVEVVFFDGFDFFEVDHEGAVGADEIGIWAELFGHGLHAEGGGESFFGGCDACVFAEGFDPKDFVDVYFFKALAVFDKYPVCAWSGLGGTCVWWFAIPVFGVRWCLLGRVCGGG